MYVIQLTKIAGGGTLRVEKIFLALKMFFIGKYKKEIK